MIIYGRLIEIWNGSKFSKWRMIYYDHKHILSLLHYNRDISSLTIRNHIDSKHCFTIWIKPSETFRNETKCPNRSPLPGRFGNQNKTHPVLARLLYIGGWSYLNIQAFFWGCGTISFVDDVQNLWMLSTRHNKIVGGNDLHHVTCIYLMRSTSHFSRY